MTIRRLLPLPPVCGLCVDKIAHQKAVWLGCVTLVKGSHIPERKGSVLLRFPPFNWGLSGGGPYGQVRSSRPLGPGWLGYLCAALYRVSQREREVSARGGSFESGCENL